MSEEEKGTNEDVHRLDGFLLTGTIEEMYGDFGNLVQNAIEFPEELVLVYNKFPKLMKHTVSSLLEGLKQCPPSHFASSTLAKRKNARKKLLECGLSPLSSQPYAQEFFFETLKHAKSSEDPPPEYLTASQMIYNICQGNNNDVILPGLRTANLSKNNTSVEEYRTAAASLVLSQYLPTDIHVIHQLTVYKSQEKSVTVDISQCSCKVGISPLISVIYEFKCDENDPDGPLYEAYNYGLYLMNNQGTNKILLFVIDGTNFSVHGQYWSGGLSYLTELQPRQSIDDNQFKTFARWLSAGVYFSQNVDLMVSAPCRPYFLSNATSPCYNLRNVYHQNGRLYKVYDKLSDNPNKIQPNILLVKKYYPKDIEVTRDDSGLFIFSCPAIFAKKIHLPKTLAQVCKFVRDVDSLHNDDHTIHGDIRPPNILFPDKPDDLPETEEFNECYLIDFDLARKIDEVHYYPENYRVEDLEILRHPNAVAGGEMQVDHDCYAVIECLKYFQLHSGVIFPDEFKTALSGENPSYSDFLELSKRF